MSSKSAMVSGMGLAMNLIVSLTKMAVDLGGKEEDLHRLVTPEGEETLRKMAKIAVDDAKDNDAKDNDAKDNDAKGEKRVPKDGDPAYSIYHGLIWEGQLKYVEWNGHWGGCWVIIPANGRKTFNHSRGHWKFLEKMVVANLGVYANATLMELTEHDESLKKFGRGQPHNKCVEYDAQRGMFYCQAYED